jgi:predicted ATPase
VSERCVAKQGVDRSQSGVSGADALSPLDGGVWFVDLAPGSDAGLVAATVAQAIGVREQPDILVAETLVGGIGDRHLLIVLDNCEHLIDSCAKLADALLRSCPRIQVVATSREPLAISGERVFRVPTLGLPDPDGDLQAVGDSESVRMFLERVSDQCADFTLNDRNAKATASICRRLDGMPLAIELAAARVASMDVSDIDERIDKRFSLLTKGARSALPRQQTLRALVDWSYDLLTNQERETPCGLSVFAGEWDLTVSEALFGADGTDVFAIADLLGSLVDKSLVQADATAFGLRYRLLETIRQFAAEKLAEQDEESADASSAHARFFLELAERAAPQLHGSRQAEWLERLEADHDNLRAAIEKLLSEPNSAPDGLRIVVALSRFFKARHPREGVEVFTAALRSGGNENPSASRAEALGVLGDIMEGRDRRRYLEEGLAMARSYGDPALAAELLTSLSWCAFQEDDPTGCSEFVEEAIAIARGTDDAGLLGRALTRKASACPWDGGMDTAGTGFEEAIDLLRTAGDLSWEAMALCNLATFESYLGDFESSETHYSQALVLVQEIGNTPGVNTILGNMGSGATLKGDFVSAKELLRRGLRGAHREGERRTCVYMILNIAECLSKFTDEQETAAQLYGAADAQNDAQLDLPWETGISEEREGEQGLLRRSMGEQAFDAAYVLGRGLTFDAAVALALGATG